MHLSAHDPPLPTQTALKIEEPFLFSAAVVGLCSPHTGVNIKINDFPYFSLKNPKLQFWIQGLGWIYLNFKIWIIRISSSPLKNVVPF